MTRIIIYTILAVFVASSANATPCAIVDAAGIVVKIENLSDVTGAPPPGSPPGSIAYCEGVGGVTQGWQRKNGKWLDVRIPPTPTPNHPRPNGQPNSLGTPDPSKRY